jgi:hypothetical protein
MKKYAYNEITTMQYIFLIFTTEGGIGVLPLPANFVKHVGTDSWVPVILGWALVSVASLVIIQVMKRPEQVMRLSSHLSYGCLWRLWIVTANADDRGARPGKTLPASFVIWKNASSPL